jgi:opacity protein-like surface antigen
MKNPALLLLLAAAAAQAQTAPVKPAAKPGEIGRIGLAFADSGDTDGYRMSVDAQLVRNVYLHGSFADLSTAGLDDTRAYSLGASYRFDFGPGRASFGAAIGALDGDTFDGDQHQLRVAYAVRAAQGLEIELSLTHYLNDLKAVAAPGYDVDDLTAPALTLRYTFAKGVGLEASFSSENSLLGIDTDDGSWSVGLNFSF